MIGLETIMEQRAVPHFRVGTNGKAASIWKIVGASQKRPLKLFQSCFDKNMGLENNDKPRGAEFNPALLVLIGFLRK